MWVEILFWYLAIGYLFVLGCMWDHHRRDDSIVVVVALVIFLCWPYVVPKGLWMAFKENK